MGAFAPGTTVSLTEDLSACHHRPMPEQSRKRQRDVAALTKSIVDDAADQERATNEGMPEKDPAAVELGRRGGLKGGPARAAKLSARKQSQIARKAAEARWNAKRT